MEIDRIPLSQLPSRYSIARSALYTRLKDLNIEPIKEGRKAYIDGQQLQLLDALHQHIQKGGTTNQFLQQTRTGQSSTNPSATPVQDSLGQIIPNQPNARRCILAGWYIMGAKIFYHAIAISKMKITCPKCGTHEVRKNGHRRGKQNYQCKQCGRQFIESYSPKGYGQDVKDKCLKMYLNGMGFRGIERVTNVNHNTVIRWVKEAGEEALKKNEI